MTKTDQSSPRTGHRPPLGDFEPRNKTVCFNLGETERNQLDQLAFCLSITRSGFLADLSTRLIADVRNGAEPTQLLELFSEALEKHKKLGAVAEKLSEEQQKKKRKL